MNCNPIPHKVMEQTQSSNLTIESQGVFQFLNVHKVHFKKESAMSS